MYRGLKKQIVIVFFMICVSVAIGIWLGLEKDVWYCDEAWTYESANSTWKDNIYEKCYEWISGNDISNYLSATEHSMKFEQILDNLYTDHVPLYFWLFRFISVVFFFENSSTWIGTVINIGIYAVLTAWLFFKLNKLYHSMILSTVVTGIFLWTLPMTLDHVTLIRMYLLLFLECALTESLIIKIIRDEYGRSIGCRLYVNLFMILVAGFLTHYYYWPLALIAVCFALIVLIYRKKWKEALYIALIAFLALLLATLLDKGKWIENILLGKENGAISQLKSSQANIVYNIKGVIYKIGDSILLFGINWKIKLGVTVFSIVSAAFLFWREKKTTYITTILFIGVSIFIHALIISAANTKDYIKYYWPPLMGWNLLFYSCLGYIVDYFLLSRKNKSAIPYILSYCLLLSLAMYNISKVDAGMGLDYLGKRTSDDRYLQSVSSIPWIIYSDQFDYNEEDLVFDMKIAERLCFMWTKDYSEVEFEIPDNTDLLLITRYSDVENAVDHINSIGDKKYEYTLVEEAHNSPFYFFILKQQELINE